MTEKVRTTLGPIRRGSIVGPPEDDLPGDSLIIDTGGFTIDDFADRTVTPPTHIAGGAVSFGSEGRIHSGAPHTATEPTIDDYPATWIGGAGSRVNHYQGSWYHAWVFIPSWTGCTGIVNAFTGWVYTEKWITVTVPAHPADMAGMMVNVKAHNGGGMAFHQATAGEVVVSSTQPTDMRQGTVVGETAIDNVSRDVFIPGEHIPAEGGTLYIGVRPRHQFNLGGWSCGWTWPFSANPGQLDRQGVDYLGGSGRFNFDWNTLAWRTWDVLGAALGDTNSSGDDEYEERPWTELGGSGTREIVNGSFQVESTAPAGWSAVGS